MSNPGRNRTVGGALVALAAGLLIAAGPAAADPIESSEPAPSLPAYQGAPATAQKIKDPTIAPQNPFMAENPNSQHPQRHVDDRRLPAQGPARPLAGRDLGCEAPTHLRQPGVRQRRPDRLGLPVAVRRSPDPDHGPGQPGDTRIARPARRGQPARHEAVSELHRRRLFLPRPQGPHLGADEDRPHPGLQRGRRRRHADAQA